MYFHIARPETIGRLFHAPSFPETPTALRREDTDEAAQLQGGAPSRPPLRLQVKSTSASTLGPKCNDCTTNWHDGECTV